jgi:hypothetical protein
MRAGRFKFRRSIVLLLVMSAVVISTALWFATSRRTPAWYGLIRSGVIEQTSQLDAHVYEPGNGTDPRSMITNTYVFLSGDPAHICSTIESEYPTAKGWRHKPFMWSSHERLASGYESITVERYPDVIQFQWPKNRRSASQRMIISQRTEAPAWRVWWTYVHNN